MKIFIDTGDLGEIKEAVAMGVIDGVTTNPSLLAKGGKSIKKAIAEICEIVDGPISAEVLATTAKEILDEGRELAKIHKNVVVKVPLIQEGLKAVRVFTSEGIRTNVTLCFSPTQALLAAKAGASYISPFVGRLDDVSNEGMELIEQIVTIYNNYDFDTEVLVARTGRKFRDVLVEICDIVKGPVSAEVVSVEYDGMMKEARELTRRLMSFSTT